LVVNVFIGAHLVPCRGYVVMKTLALLMSLSLLLAACAPASPVATPTELTATANPTPTPTITPTPTETPLPPTATATPNVEATQTVEFEATKAEALQMVSIKLETPDDLKNLPVLDDVKDFDSGKVQEEERWLIDHVLPKANIKLPITWRINKDKSGGFSWIDYNAITEPDIVDYRGVSAFFVMHNGKKMLRIGVEYGGPGQLIHFNFEDPTWWTNPKWTNDLIAAFNRDGWQIMPVIQFGTETAFAPEIYNNEVNLERLKTGDQFFADWVNYRQLPDGADRIVISGQVWPWGVAK
jgi:hypothetical protein